MFLLRYTRFYICDTVPPCRVHVHMFTIIQFLRARANIHTVLEAENMFIVSMETTGYKIVIDQSLALYAIYKHDSRVQSARENAYYKCHTSQMHVI